MASKKKRAEAPETVTTRKQRVEAASRDGAPVPATRTFGGAALGAAALYVLSEIVGAAVLPRLRETLYWSSWYFLVPSLMAPVGAVLGILTVLARHRREAVFAWAGILAVSISVWFLVIALNNEIVQKFVLNPNGWTHNHLPSTTVWFLSYYLIPFGWALGLMWRCRPIVDGEGTPEDMSQ